MMPASKIRNYRNNFLYKINELFRTNTLCLATISSSCLNKSEEPATDMFYWKTEQQYHFRAFSASRPIRNRELTAFKLCNSRCSVSSRGLVSWCCLPPRYSFWQYLAFWAGNVGLAVQPVPLRVKVTPMTLRISHLRHLPLSEAAGRLISCRKHNFHWHRCDILQGQ